MCKRKIKWIKPTITDLGKNPRVGEIAIRVYKKLDWQKPELVEFTHISRGIVANCIGGSGNQNCDRGCFPSGSCGKGGGVEE